MQGLFKAGFSVVDSLCIDGTFRPEQLCRVARRCRGAIGHEVGNAVVDFVPYSCKNGQTGFIDGPG